MKLDPKQTLKTVGILFALFVLTYAVLQLIIHLGDAYGMPWIYIAGTAVYAAAVVGLFCAFYVLNGFTLNRTEYEREDLPDKWSEERKTEFLRKLPENREKAKRLIYILMPLVVTLLVSYIKLTFFGS